MLDEKQRAEAISSNKIAAAEAPRLLAVDNEMVVPVDKIVRVQVTAADVLHSFAMPSFGIKIDAVPGRLNETWFKADREGVYYGQCSELCGNGPPLHADHHPRRQRGSTTPPGSPRRSRNMPPMRRRWLAPGVAAAQ